MNKATRTNTNVLEGIIRRNAYSTQRKYSPKWLQGVHRDLWSIPDGVFLVANAQLEDFPIVYVSDKFTGKMGYTRADLIGQPITLDFMGNKEATSMLQQYLVNISRTSTKLLSGVNLQKIFAHIPMRPLTALTNQLCSTFWRHYTVHSILTVYVSEQ